MKTNREKTILKKIQFINIGLLILFSYLAFLLFVSAQENKDQDDVQMEKDNISRDVKNISLKDYDQYCHNLSLKKKYALSIYCYEYNYDKYHNEININYPMFYIYLSYNYIMIGDLKKAEEFLSKYCLYGYFGGKEPATDEEKRGYEIARIDLVINEFLSAYTKQSFEKAVEYARIFQQKYPNFKNDKINSADRAIKTYERVQQEIRDEKKRYYLASLFFTEIERAINKNNMQGLYNILRIHSSNDDVLDERYSYFSKKFINICNVKFKIYVIRRYHSANYKNIITWRVCYTVDIDSSVDYICNDPCKYSLIVIFNDKMIINDWRK